MQNGYLKTITYYELTTYAVNAQLLNLLTLNRIMIDYYAINLLERKHKTSITILFEKFIITNAVNA